MSTSQRIPARTPSRTQTKFLTDDDDGLALTAADAGTVFIANTGAMSVLLPAVANTAGVAYTFVKTTADAEIITIDGAASELINAATTFASLDAADDSVTVASNGTKWWVIRKQIAA
jgi:hypothetical protein